MVFIRLLYLCPPILLLFIPSSSSYHTTQLILDSIQDQFSNDSIIAGSGIENEGSGSISLSQDIDPSSLTIDSSTLQSIDKGMKMMSIIDKRATDPTKHKLGNLPNELLGKVSLLTNRVPPINSYEGLGRKLKKGPGKYVSEYVVYFIQGGSRIWGKMFYDVEGVLQSHFVYNNAIINNNGNFRVILFPSNAPSIYDLNIEWILGRDVDPLAIIVLLDTRGNYKKKTSGVYVNGEYEYLGEADIENRLFTYTDNNEIHVVQGDRFDQSVYVMTKTRCTCNCPNRSVFANIKDFFG